MILFWRFTFFSSSFYCWTSTVGNPVIWLLMRGSIISLSIVFSIFLTWTIPILSKWLVMHLLIVFMYEGAVKLSWALWRVIYTGIIRRLSVYSFVMKVLEMYQNLLYAYPFNPKIYCIKWGGGMSLLGSIYSVAAIAKISEFSLMIKLDGRSIRFIIYFIYPCRLAIDVLILNNSSGVI